ncbi:MAG: glycosyltransferase, partial [Hyphomicrobium sp.]
MGEAAGRPDERAGRLMVILADPLSPLIDKGEVTARYYNPGDVFTEVDFVICAVDEPERAAVQQMVGNARFAIHCFPIGREWTVRSLFWRPLLLRAWTRPIVELARVRQPQVVRCYHNRYNAFAAAEIKRLLGIPYVVSLHAHPETSQVKRLSSAYVRHRLREAALEGISRHGLAGAAAILPVYSPIVPWLQRRGVSNYEIVYNAVGTLEGPVERKPRGAMLRAINVGRQDADVKDPTPIIEAVAARDDVKLTVVGNGPLHEALVGRVAALGAQDR